MAIPANLLKDALSLEAPKRAELVDELLASRHSPDRSVDELWAVEVESRIDAYDRGEIGSLSVQEVIEPCKTK